MDELHDHEELLKLIERWERVQKEAAAVLPHLRAAAAALGVSANGSSESKPKAAKARPKPKNLFEPKYGKSAGNLALNLLRDLEGDKSAAGLSLRGILDALADQNKSFSSQAMNLALKKLQKEGKIKKVPAPRNSNATWHYRYNPEFAVDPAEVAAEAN